MFATVGFVLYVADSGFHCVRAVNMKAVPPTVTTIVGTGGTSGDKSSTNLNTPSALALSTDYKTLYIADTGNNVIRAQGVSASNGVATAQGALTILAGTGTADSVDGTVDKASFFSPMALAADFANVYVGEAKGTRLRVIKKADGSVSTALGTTNSGGAVGDNQATRFNAITGLTAQLDDSGVMKTIYLYDPGDSNNVGARIVKVTPN